MDLTLWGWAAALLAAVLVGMSKGGLPVVGMLSVPILALVMSPVQAAGLLLPVYVVSDMFGLYAYRKAFDARILKILVLPSALGVTVGWATASLVPEKLVGGLVGAIGVAFALNALLRRPVEGPPVKPKLLPGIFWGTISGFTSFVSHSGAPPYQVYVLPLRLEKAVFAGTSTILFAWINAIKLIPYYALGQLTLDSVEVAAALMLPAAAAVFLGVWLTKVLPTKLFFKLVLWALLAVSLRLLWEAF
ncbi:sulfite exporter TauE/SafE family protein [Phaeovulum sp. W22_SRMD_FR3]|uniref:sulfite exporter TauE/SafE family protein n=1 Tax=Phaeovulum sp. W22_SRMD_FR3 TaxID=3240274 RepID=UPI003F9ACF20